MDDEHAIRRMNSEVIVRYIHKMLQNKDFLEMLQDADEETKERLAQKMRKDRRGRDRYQYGRWRAAFLNKSPVMDMLIDISKNKKFLKLVKEYKKFIQDLHKSDTRAEWDPGDIPMIDGDQIDRGACKNGSACIGNCGNNCELMENGECVDCYYG